MFWNKTDLQPVLTACQQQLDDSNTALKAIRTNVAYIEFTPEGVVTRVNPLFLQATGYQEQEVLGQHHRLFCDKDYVASADYKQFWRELASGESHSGVLNAAPNKQR